jgi:hypothetical protein
MFIAERQSSSSIAVKSSEQLPALGFPCAIGLVTYPPSGPGNLLAHVAVVLLDINTTGKQGAYKQR